MADKIADLAALIPPGLDISTWNFQDTSTRAPALYVVCGVVISLSTLFVALRLYARYFIIGHISISDKLVVVALVFANTMSLLAIIACSKFGLGHHVYTFKLPTMLDSISRMLTMFYSMSIVYHVALTLVKLSVLAFYLHLSAQKTFRRLTIFMMVLSSAQFIVGVSVTIFQCRPYNPMLWVYVTSRNCINYQSFWSILSAINMVSDLVLYVMPLPLLWGLHLPLRQRLVVCGMLGLGALVCVSGMMRLVYNLKDISLNSKIDITWSIVNPTIFSNLEAHLGIICSCIPPIKPLAQNLGLLGTVAVSQGSNMYKLQYDKGVRKRRSVQEILQTNVSYPARSLGKSGIRLTRVEGVTSTKTSYVVRERQEDDRYYEEIV